MKNFVLTVILSLVCLLGKGQKVTHLTTGTPVAGGNTYFLPQVGLVVNVPVTTTTYTFGPAYNCGFEHFYLPSDLKKELADYVEAYEKKAHYDDRNHIDIRPYREYELEKATLQTKSLIDRNKGYEMSICGAGKKVSFSYDDNGFLVSGSVENNNDPVALLLKVAEVAIPFITAWGPFYKATKAEDKVPCPTIQKTLNYRKLKDDLLSLTTVAGGGLTIQLEAIDKQIQYHMDQILKVSSRTETVSFFVLPDSTWLTGNGEKELFSFDSDANVLTVSDQLSPMILSPMFDQDRVKIGAVSNGYKLVLKSLLTENRADYFSNRADDKHKGLAYNIPVKATVRIQKDQIIVVNQSIEFPQFGKVGYLPHRLKKMDFTLNPQTGALQAMTGESKSLINADHIDRAGKLAEQFKKEPSPTEKEKLTEEVSVLELQVKKKKALAELEKGN